MLLNQLIPDIIKNIYDRLGFIAQVKLRLVSKFFVKYEITNLFDDVPNYHRLTDNILKLYPYIIKLDVSHNKKITNINHLVNLQVLNANGFCGIGNKEILSLTNLTELYVRNNINITDVNHLTNLKILDADGYCGIDNMGIRLLTNLVQLSSLYNDKITIKID